MPLTDFWQLVGTMPPPVHPHISVLTAAGDAFIVTLSATLSSSARSCPPPWFLGVLPEITAQETFCLQLLVSTHSCKTTPLPLPRSPFSFSWKPQFREIQTAHYRNTEGEHIALESGGCCRESWNRFYRKEWIEVTGGLGNYRCIMMGLGIPEENPHLC